MTIRDLPRLIRVTPAEAVLVACAVCAWQALVIAPDDAQDGYSGMGTCKEAWSVTDWGPEPLTDFRW